MLISESEETNGLYDPEALEWSTTILWNGREIQRLDAEQIQSKALSFLNRVEQIHKRALAILKTEPASALNALKDRLIEQIFLEELVSLEELLEEHGYAFEHSEAEMRNCKSLFGHIKRGVKELGKGVKKVGKHCEKGARKVKKVATKVYKEGTHFVKEHKTECLVAVGLVVVGGIGIAIAGALNGRKEGEDLAETPPTDPVPSDLLSPNPASALPPPVVSAPQGLDFNQRENIKAIEALKLPSYSFKSPFALFLESQGSMLPPSPQVSPSNSASEAPKSFSPTFQTAALSFLETVRQGAEMIGRGLSEPELFDPHAPLELFCGKDKNLSNDNAFPSGQSAISFLEAIEERLQQGLDTMGHSEVDPELFAPHSPFDPFKASPASMLPSELAQQNAETPPNNTFFSHIFPNLFIAEYSLKPIDSSLSSERSRYFETEGEKRKDMSHTSINGIANAFVDALSNANYLRKLGSSLCIEGIYNQSNSAVIDLTEVFTCNYLGFSPVTSDLLIQKWSEFHHRNADQPSAKILHFCHSQGTLHTKNALLRLPKEIRDRVIVVAIAPAAVVPKKLCHESFNFDYYKEIDIEEG